MNVYSTLSPQTLQQFFTPSQYDAEAAALLDRAGTPAHPVERFTYRADQPVTDTTLFLLAPSFFQANLVQWMLKHANDPIYLTLYQEERPNDPLYAQIGTLITPSEVADVLDRLPEVLKIVDEFTTLILPLLREMQRTAPEDMSLWERVTKPLRTHKPANQPGYVPLATGTDHRRNASGKASPYPIAQFENAGAVYYCVFRPEKIELFRWEGTRREAELDNETLIEQYMDALVMDGHVAKAANLLDEAAKALKKAGIESKKILSSGEALCLRFGEMQAIPISEPTYYKHFGAFVRDSLDRDMDPQITIRRKDACDTSDLYSRYVMYFLQKMLQKITLTAGEKGALYSLIPEIAFRKFFGNVAREDITIGVMELTDKMQKRQTDEADSTQIGQLTRTLRENGDQFFFRCDTGTLKENIRRLNNNIINTRDTKQTAQRVYADTFSTLQKEKTRIKDALRRGPCFSQEMKKELFAHNAFDHLTLSALLEKLTPTDDSGCADKIRRYFELDVREVEDDDTYDTSPFPCAEKEAEKLHGLDRLKSYIRTLLSRKVSLGALDIRYMQYRSDEIRDWPIVDLDELTELNQQLIERFMLSYQQFDSRHWEYLQMQPYMQLLLTFLITRLGDARGATPREQEIAGKFKMLLYITNKHGKDPEVCEWRDDFILRAVSTLCDHPSCLEAINWSYLDSLVADALTDRLCERFGDQVAPETIKTFVKSRTQASVLLAYYCFAIIDVAQSPAEAHDVDAIVDALITGKSRTKNQYPLFKHFLSCAYPKDSEMFKRYLQQVVIDPNREVFLQDGGDDER